jgi:hypothetical protein
MPNHKGNEGQVLTFRKWLESQQDLDNPIGDLAKDALQDTGWEGDSSDSLLLRMKELGADPAPLEAFRKAQRKFKALSFKNHLDADEG